jgi:hypothetical protein
MFKKEARELLSCVVSQKGIRGLIYPGPQILVLVMVTTALRIRNSVLLLLAFAFISSVPFSDNRFCVQCYNFVFPLFSDI